MFQLLIVAATWPEIRPFAEHVKAPVNHPGGIVEAKLNPGIHLLVTGVGMVNTAFALGAAPLSNYRTIVNAGICGAFNRTLQLGELVVVKHDTLSEMGAEDGDEFIPYTDLGLGGTNTYSCNAPVHAAFRGIKEVNGITVNKVHGSEATIAAAASRFSPDVESMEGAAFLRACSHLQSPYYQLRAVSNYVERRNRAAWNIPLAVSNLNAKLIELTNILTN